MDEHEQKQLDTNITLIFVKTLEIFAKTMQSLCTEVSRQTLILQEIKIGLEQERNRKRFNPPMK